MSELTIRNVLAYLSVFILPPVADAVYQYLQAQMAAGKPIDWGQVDLIALMALLAAVVAATRPRVGHEAIAAQVDYLQAGGMPKSEMTVLHQDEAVPALAGALTPGQVSQLVEALHDIVVAELEKRMRLTPMRGTQEGT